MRIEHITTEDLSALESFLSRCGSSLETFRYFASRPLTIIKNHEVTLLGFDACGKPVAYGHLDSEKGTIWLGICVAENNRGKGYGGAIMRALLDVASERKLASISLTVDASNANAAKMYEKYGFKLAKQSEKTLWYVCDVSPIS